MNSLTDSIELTYDWVEFEGNPEIIDLDTEQIEQASTLSKQARNKGRQWQIYYQALALFAFEEWLRQREPSLAIQRDTASVFQEQYANVLDAVCNLRVGEFKVCLIPSFSFTDSEVTLPRAVVDLPEFAAHFYVLIVLEEELEVAAIRGFIPYDQLVNYLPQLQPDEDWTYPLSLPWFNLDTDELLLYLQCLVPTAITLPEIPTNRQANLAQMQAELLSLLPQLYNRPWWEVLTWEQGAAVLTAPDLLNWFAHSFDENTPAATNYLADLLQILTQQAINVRQWFRQQVDEVVQSLSWEILPAPSPTRTKETTPEQELEAILTDIQRRDGLEIPESAVRAYQDILLEIRLRLYAVTWYVSPEDNQWNLLLVLKSLPDAQFIESSPFTYTMRVSGLTGVLAEENLQVDGDIDYIFVAVEGSYEDKFLVTITSETGATYSFPPFEFSQRETFS